MIKHKALNKQDGERALFQYPEASQFGRVIPKEEIYRRARLKGELKQDFIHQIAKIQWTHKLSEETTNIQGSEQFKEFEVITILLKGDTLNIKCLETIDRIIPFPLIFEVVRFKTESISGDASSDIESIQTIAAYKTLKDGAVKLESRYYHSPRYEADTERRPLPQSITIKHLYKALISILLQCDSQENLKEKSSANVRQRADNTLYCSLGEDPTLSKTVRDEQKGPFNIEQSLEEQIAQEETRRKLAQAIERIERRIPREKQFNKRVELNETLKKLQAKLKALV